MENATKALLIAAAILIAIVLVSIGVYVLRQGQEAVGSVNLSESEILAFNSKFTSYEGTQRGSNVKALVDRVIASNREQGDSGAKIAVTGAVTIASGATTSSGTISTSAYYKVTMTDSGSENNVHRDKTGLIKQIDIENLSN